MPEGRGDDVMPLSPALVRLRALGRHGCFTADLGQAGEWVARVRDVVRSEPGSPGWVRDLLAFVRSVVAPSRDAWGRPEDALYARRGRFDAMVHAYAWLAMEGFGINVEARYLVHRDGTDKHAVALVGPLRWVVDPWFGVAYTSPAGVPATFGDLLAHPEWVAAVGVLWRAPDGTGVEGFFHEAATIPRVDPGPPAEAGAGWGWASR